MPLTSAKKLADSLLSSKLRSEETIQGKQFANPFLNEKDLEELMCFFLPL